ncbi:hypothetical protein TCA2_4533 [Paenibacillus sp. TCA20]|uniref:PilZ domain-containing protein n=1 Tax=Paenibacillus urinalis TaxID=521520 RepID=A0ABY7XHA3_9BACL|nr:MULTISPECIES: hypothetical protein [Paenibacillus]WDI05134.1 hypothetical protein PUW25_25335 [Paenibacillus urinalis]GAK42041.1 hypothetical protein TCA2_4533 [Paenibacillus sp. TCA20]
MAEIRKKGGNAMPVRVTNQMTSVRNESPIPDSVDSQTFLTKNAFVSGTLFVSLNGMRMHEGEDNDYIELSSQKFRFNFPLESEDAVICDYILIL